MKNLILIGMACLVLTSCNKEQIAPSSEGENIESVAGVRSAGPLIIATPIIEDCCNGRRITYGGKRNVTFDIDALTNSYYNGNGFGLRYLFYRQVGSSHILQHNILSFDNDPTFCINAGLSYKVVVIKGTCSVGSMSILGCSYDDLVWSAGSNCAASQIQCFKLNSCGGVQIDPPIK